jgi:hypothetical protein
MLPCASMAAALHIKLSNLLWKEDVGRDRADEPVNLSTCQPVNLF